MKFSIFLFSIIFLLGGGIYAQDSQTAFLNESGLKNFKGDKKIIKIFIKRMNESTNDYELLAAIKNLGAVLTAQDTEALRVLIPYASYTSSSTQSLYNRRGWAVRLEVLKILAGLVKDDKDLSKSVGAEVRKVFTGEDYPAVKRYLYRVMGEMKEPQSLPLIRRDFLIETNTGLLLAGVRAVKEIGTGEGLSLLLDVAFTGPYRFLVRQEAKGAIESLLGNNLE